MKRYIILICFFVAAPSLFAQQKELTLDDAVLKRFSTLGPERLGDLQWVTNTSMVSWQSKESDKIMIRKPGTRAPIQEIPVTDINSALSLELERFPRIEWLGSGNFFFQNKNKVYTYSISSNTGKKLLSLPEGIKC